jgi:hypothetical protein
VTCGIATFVKTPGQTPLKTRLAAGIGQDQAHKFYTLACQAIRSILEKTPVHITAYWAVAEQGQTDYWHQFPNLWQGVGGLGDRLHKIYGELLFNHKVGMLIGADCPQISTSMVNEAFQTCRNSQSFVLGPASDGGFYLLAGSKTIPHGVWNKVPYSHADTYQLLKAELQKIGSVVELDPLTDVDTKDDLAEMIQEMNRIDLTQDQEVLLQWLSDLKQI